MGWLSDLHDGNKHWFSEQFKAVKDDPERLFLGAMTPVGTKLWGGITGEDWNPVMDAWGGPSADVYASGEARGLNMDAAHNSHRVARLVAGAAMAGGAMGGGETASSGATNPALIESAAGTPGYGASSAGAGGGSSSWWKTLVDSMGSNGMSGGGQQGGQRSGFDAFNDSFQRGYDPQGYERRKAREDEMAIRARQEAREDERHAMAMAQMREAEAKRRRIDEALARVRSLSQDGVVAGTQGGMSSGGAAHLMANGYGDATGPAAVQAAAGDFAREGRRAAMAPGATAATTAEAEAAQRLATQGLRTRQATDADIFGAASEAALTAGDVGQWVGLRGEAKKAKFDDVFNTAREQYKALSDKDKVQIAEQRSRDEAFPGSGSFVYAKTTGGKDMRYMHYRTEGGKHLELSDDDVADLAGLEAAMKVDPMRARAEIRKLNDNAKAAALEMFKIGLEGAKLNNQVAENQDRMRLGWAELGVRREGLKFQQDRLGREVSPQTLKQLSELEQAYISTDDPKQRASIDRQYQMVLSRAGAEVGRPMGLPRADSRPAVSEQDLDAVIGRLQGEYPKGKVPSYAALRAQALSLITGAAAGETLKVPGGAAQPASTKSTEVPRIVPQKPASSAPEPQRPPSSANPNSWLYRGGVAPQAAAATSDTSLYDMYRRRGEGLPPGVTQSGLGFMVNGEVFFNRDAAIRAAGY